MRAHGVPAGKGGTLAAQMLQNKWDKEGFYSQNGIVNPEKRWDEFRDDYIRLYSPPAHSESSWIKLKLVVREFEAAVKPIYVRSICTNDILHWRKQRMMDGQSLRTIDSEERVLRPMLRSAWADKLMELDPFAKTRLQKLRFVIPEPIHLSLPEANHFLDVLSQKEPEYLLLGVMAYETGMRVGELTHIRIEDIDFMGGLAHLKQHEGFCVCSQCKKQETPGWTGKAGVPRKIPLSPRANAMLLQLFQERKSGNVFPLAPNTVAGIFKRTFASAGIKGKAATHIFRHTFATHCSQAGVREAVTSRILGHATQVVSPGESQMTKSYTHMDGDEELQRQYQQLLDWRAGHQTAQISAIGGTK